MDEIISPPACTPLPPGTSSPPRKTRNSQRIRGAEQARAFVTQALDACAAPQVARRLGVSPDLVRGWAHGRSSLSLGDLIAAPRAFRQRIVTLLGEVADPTGQDPAQLLSRAQGLLGQLILACSRPLATLDGDQLQRACEAATQLEEAGRALRSLYLAEVETRAEILLARGSPPL